MNESTKKIVLGVVILAAVVGAVISFQKSGVAGEKVEVVGTLEDANKKSAEAAGRAPDPLVPDDMK